MHWRRFVWAVACGIAVSALLTATVHTLRVFEYMHELAAWITPNRVAPMWRQLTRMPPPGEVIASSRLSRSFRWLTGP